MANGKTPRFLDKVRTILHRKHYANSTEKTYINWIKRFIDQRQLEFPPDDN